MDLCWHAECICTEAAKIWGWKLSPDWTIAFTLLLISSCVACSIFMFELRRERKPQCMYVRNTRNQISERFRTISTSRNYCVYESNYTRAAFTKSPQHTTPNHSNGIMHFFTARTQLALRMIAGLSPVAHTFPLPSTGTHLQFTGILSHNRWFKGIELELLQQITEYKIWSRQKLARASVCRAPAKSVECTSYLFVQSSSSSENWRWNHSENHDWIIGVVGVSAEIN